MKNTLTSENRKQSGIYLITNSVDSRVYIGSTNNFSLRLKHHLWRLNSGTGSPRLQDFANEHGLSALTFSVLEVCAPEQKLNREQYYLDHYQAAIEAFGFNVAAIAGSRKGVGMSDKNKQELAARMKVRGVPELIAYAKSEKHKTRIAEANSKRVWTDEQRAHTSAQRDKSSRASRVESIWLNPRAAAATPTLFCVQASEVLSQC